MQDLGFLAFALAQVAILMLARKPRGEALTVEQSGAAMPHRRLRIEHVHSRVKRCRVVKDRIRLRRKGIREAPTLAAVREVLHTEPGS